MLIQTLLKEIPFFWDFSEGECTALTTAESFFITYQDGEYLITEGDADENLFVILKGEANVVGSSEPDQVIATLQPGAVVGEVSFLTKRKRTTNIIASGEVIVFRIDSYSMNRERLDLALQTKIKNQLIEILVQRLEATNKALGIQKKSNFALSKALREQVLAARSNVSKDSVY
ncbi:MAG: cyclic nucleotide-binding domain-containing protein [Magnetococcales bacterium]|nr:cyclic nucleotide-binding domain-containing protein [Magnetococcales bacterium]